ncbi:MAG: hypothetical protein DWQ36_16810 [Acidobacteria bacterium]|nr:MAG: hypothetical protein DWQ30_14980 [Acidobacteriota bacterium]REK04514.1 MAG: hypothetical protein DWQ36_16810 [Acidobacteriota bacterium]
MAARVAACGLFALASVAGPASASDMTGFLAEKGSGTLALGHTIESYDRFWVGETKVYEPALDEIETASTALYLRYGLTDSWSLIVGAAHVDAEASGPANLEDSGFQDLSVLLARRLWSGSSSGGARHDLVGAFGVRTPTESYEANSPVARGDETTDVLLRFVYLLRKGRLYWSQQVGFDLRSEDAPDGIPLYTEIGYSFGSRVTAIASISQHFADGGTDIGDPGFTFPSNREESLRAGLKAVVRLERGWGLFGGVFDTLDGRNTGDATGVSAGVIFDF